MILSYSLTELDASGTPLVYSWNTSNSNLISTWHFAVANNGGPASDYGLLSLNAVCNGYPYTCSSFLNQSAFSGSSGTLLNFSGQANNGLNANIASEASILAVFGGPATLDVQWVGGYMEEIL